MRLADYAVLRAVARDVLDPAVVREALDLALRELEQPDTAAAARLDTLKSELARLDRCVAHVASPLFLDRLAADPSGSHDQLLVQILKGESAF